MGWSLRNNGQPISTMFTRPSKLTYTCLFKKTLDKWCLLIGRLTYSLFLITWLQGFCLLSGVVITLKPVSLCKFTELTFFQSLLQHSVTWPSVLWPITYYKYRSMVTSLSPISHLKENSCCVLVNRYDMYFIISLLHIVPVDWDATMIPWSNILKP